MGIHKTGAHFFLCPDLFHGLGDGENERQMKTRLWGQLCFLALWQRIVLNLPSKLFLLQTAVSREWCPFPTARNTSENDSPYICIIYRYACVKHFYLGLVKIRLYFTKRLIWDVLMDLRTDISVILSFHLFLYSAINNNQCGLLLNKLHKVENKS